MYTIIQFWDNCTLILIVFRNIDTDIGNHKHNAHIKQIYYPNPLALWIVKLKICWMIKVIIIYYHMNSLLTLIYWKFWKRMWHTQCCTMLRSESILVDRFFVETESILQESFPKIIDSRIDSEGKRIEWFKRIE